MAITAAMVKELREMTGAGMMDCKKALTKCDGNMDEAVEFLRKNGQAKAEKKATRKASAKKEDKEPVIQNQAASTTLGDIDALAALKQQLEGEEK